MSQRSKDKHSVFDSLDKDSKARNMRLDSMKKREMSDLRKTAS